MNNEGSWQECIATNAAVAVSPNKAKARALQETAQGRIDFLSKIIPTTENVNYIFENYYASILELAHALVIQEGYKVNNHICLGHYLRDKLQKENVFRMFDDCRTKRNALVYYGRKMDPEVAKESIEKSKRLIAELLITLK